MAESASDSVSRTAGEGASAGAVWARYNLTPIAKPRMTNRDKWHSRPITRRYWFYKAEVQKLVRSLPQHAHVVFQLPMPKSWSIRKRALYDRGGHFVRPDIDNLHKGLLDAIYQEDCGVWDHRVTKIWGVTGCIYVREIAPPELPL